MPTLLNVRTDARDCWERPKKWLTPSNRCASAARLMQPLSVSVQEGRRDRDTPHPQPCSILSYSHFGTSPGLKCGRRTLKSRSPRTQTSKVLCSLCLRTRKVSNGHEERQEWQWHTWQEKHTRDRKWRPSEVQTHYGLDPHYSRF